MSVLKTLKVPENRSVAEYLALLSVSKRDQILASLTSKETDSYLYNWRGFWARPKQVAPDGPWSVWVLRAGRGNGKTRSGLEWMHERALLAPRHIALVARTPAEARDHIIEGPGGLRNLDPATRPIYEISKKRLTWKNGSWATVYSDEEPDQLRGFSGDTAWLDEFAKFKNPVDTWDNLNFGMREASTDQPRRLITTTPRPIPILKDIEKPGLPLVVVTLASSYENVANLDPRWFKDIIAQYEGTRLGRQELQAEILDDVPGALWTRTMLDQAMHKKSDPLPEFQRVVVGVDPSGTSGSDEGLGNQVGIVAVAKGTDGLAYVLSDQTCILGPAGWGRRVVETYSAHSADKIVVERNFGGAMAEHVIRTADKHAPIKMVTASRGKIARAEPVAALYEQGRVKHVATVPELEDQMCAFTSDGYVGGGSPDRVDALVWAITELMLLRAQFEGMESTSLPYFGS